MVRASWKHAQNYVYERLAYEPESLRVRIHVSCGLPVYTFIDSHLRKFNEKHPLLYCPVMVTMFTASGMILTNVVVVFFSSLCCEQVT